MYGDIGVGDTVAEAGIIIMHLGFLVGIRVELMEV
jgi:hypothetical protein